LPAQYFSSIAIDLFNTRRTDMANRFGPDILIQAQNPVVNVDEAKTRLVKLGCEVVKDEPDVPRCYVKDPFGLIYNLTK
jgi:hypothetical protein